MAAQINTPLTGDIWHLCIDDLLAPLPEQTRLGGPGPFVINLSASTAPIGVPKHIAGCQHAHVYQLQRTEDHRVRYRLRLGPFADEDEADAILKMVRDIYPSALTATADADDLRSIASIEAKASAQQSPRVKAEAAKPAAIKPPATTPPVIKPVKADKKAALFHAPQAPHAAAPARTRVAAEPPVAARTAAPLSPALEMAQVIHELLNAPAPARAVPVLPATMPAPPKVVEVAEVVAAEPPVAAQPPADLSPALEIARVIRELASAPVPATAPVIPVLSSPAVRSTAAAVPPQPIATPPARVVAAEPPVSAEPPALLSTALEIAQVIRELGSAPVSASPPVIPVLSADAAVSRQPVAAPTSQIVVAKPAASPAPTITAAAAPPRVIAEPAPQLVAAPQAEIVAAKPLATSAPVAAKPTPVAAKPALVAVQAVPEAVKAVPVAAKPVQEAAKAVAVVAKPMPEAAKAVATVKPAPARAIEPLPRTPAMAMVMTPPRVEPKLWQERTRPPAAPPVEQVSMVELDLETTQTVRALTPMELEDDVSARWFVIQLSLSEEAFDSETVPDLDIFSVYRLYCVAGIDQGRVVHALRLGFFGEEIAADAVASYLAEYYDKPTVKRVSAAERHRFADQRFEPRKDIGATGKHAVIEITDERYVRERRSTGLAAVPESTNRSFSQPAHSPRSR
ncbi:MAG TPA: SPOR domain-containing protein [Steroidobacteraceae bacterium]|nr:SPOR domain-containing protein [Steroidobacteraceae bacterium]